jgi:hypothetical protein
VPDETPEARRQRLSQKDNEHTPGVEGSYKPDSEQEGYYVKSDAAPNPSWVDFRIKLTEAEYKELAHRKKMADQVKKHKARFSRDGDKENGGNKNKNGAIGNMEMSAVHSVLPYVDKKAIEDSLYRAR